jgi:hypothetical protein
MKTRIEERYPMLFPPNAVDRGQITVNRPSPGQIRTFKLSERYLSQAVNVGQVSLDDAEDVFIKSTKGTGKTEVLGDFVESLPSYASVIQIGHRRSLSRSLAQRLHLTSYLDTDKLKRRFSLSIDSLPRVDPNIVRVWPYDVVIIDESEQVFRHLVGDTAERKRGQIFSTLLWLIQNAKKVICSDADLTGDLTIHLVSKLRGNFEQDRVTAIINEWHVGRAINVFESKEHALAQLVSEVAEGKRVYVPVAEKKLADQIETLMKFVRGPNGEEIKVLSLTGDTSDTKEAIDFFANPDTESVKYQVVIATSTLSTGVSIDVEWFDAIYGLFDGSVYTYQDCDQAISRVRSCESVNVWVHYGTPQKFDTEADLRDGPVRKELMTRRLIMPGDDPSLTPVEKLYLDVESRIRWCEQEWSCDRATQFIDLKKADGWTVNWIPTHKPVMAAGREMLKIARDPNGERRYRPILNAENLLEDEFEHIKNVQSLSNAKKRAVSKYYVAKVFDLSSPSDVTMTHLKQYYEDDARNKVKNLKLMAASEEDAMLFDRNEREVPRGKSFTSFDHRVIRQEIMNGLLQVSGVSPADVLQRANRHGELLRDLAEAKSTQKRDSRPYRDATSLFKSENEANLIVVGDDQLHRVLDYVGEHLARINLFLKTRFIQSDLEENQTKVFNRVMGEFGIVIKRDVKKKAKRYIVDFEKVGELAKSEKLRAIVEEIRKV